MLLPDEIQDLRKAVKQLKTDYVGTKYARLNIDTVEKVLEKLEAAENVVLAASMVVNLGLDLSIPNAYTPLHAMLKKYNEKFGGRK